MKKRWIGKKFRHVYRYSCIGCGRLRLAYDHARAAGMLCTLCEARTPPRDQTSLFNND